MSVALALIAFYGGLTILGGPGSVAMYRWHGVALIGVGTLLVLLLSRGFGRRWPRSRRVDSGPSFTADDPEVADLPPTTTTRLGEQIKRARERRKRARD